jgi:hypothetical protein
MRCCLPCDFDLEKHNAREARAKEASSRQNAGTGACRRENENHRDETKITPVESAPAARHHEKNGGGISNFEKLLPPWLFRSRPQ